MLQTCIPAVVMTVWQRPTSAP